MSYFTCDRCGGHADKWSYYTGTLFRLCEGCFKRMDDELVVCPRCVQSFRRSGMTETPGGPVCPSCAATPTAAVRSPSNACLSWTSLPPLGMFALARNAGEGKEKYGLYNWLLGLQQHEVLDHMASHFWLYVSGDRSEQHMAKVAWGALVAVHNELLRPDVCKMMPGPGYSLTDDIRAYLDANRDRLAAERRVGKHDDAGRWTLDSFEQGHTIIAQAGVDPKAPSPLGVENET